MLAIVAAIVVSIVLRNNTKGIVEGPEVALTISNPDVHITGEVYVVGTLEEEMKNYGYDDAYFHVRASFDAWV